MYVKRCIESCEKAYIKPKECTQRGTLYKYGQKYDPKDIKNQNLQNSKIHKKSKSIHSALYTDILNNKNDKNVKRRIEKHCEEFWGEIKSSKTLYKIDKKTQEKCQKIKEKIQIENQKNDQEFNFEELSELKKIANSENKHIHHTHHTHTMAEITQYSKKLHKAKEKLDFKDFMEHVDFVYQRQKDTRKPLRDKRIIKRKRPECKSIHLVEFDEEREAKIKMKMIEKSKNPNLLKYV